jgi:Mn-dependent DtxR family transcriptional regulator
MCYSSQDNAIVSSLSEQLLAQGIDIWLDKWEIRPGDSLRRKIDEGLEETTYFFVILSEHSLKSEWVQTELDAAMVQKIQGKCSLIPILYGIDDYQVPLTLRGMKWIRLDNYDDCVREIVGLCFELSKKPAVGLPPKWVTRSTHEELVLSPNAEAIGKLLAQKSENALNADISLRPEEIGKELGLNDNEMALAVDELEEEGMVELVRTSSMGKAGFSYIFAQSELFFKIDPIVKGWDPKEDAKMVAVVAVNRNKPYVRSQELAEDLKWEPRRLNSALQFLELHGYVDVSKAMGSAPYCRDGFAITSRTKRFASN